ncbi:MAG: D-sedoheptulose 7-phosphate isomerase [Dongiaceae bacterium]
MTDDTDRQRQQLASAAFDGAARRFLALKAEAATVARAGGMLVDCFEGGGKAMFCGNGGSAADSQHLAAELLGRYMKDRPPLPALSLTVDTSVLTAVGNDYGYAEVFERQVRGLGRPGDVLVGLSTSGNSENVLRAFAAARALGVRTIGLTGQGGGRMAGAADLCIRVPSGRTNEIQEMHIAIGHLLCEMVETALFQDIGGN